MRSLTFPFRLLLNVARGVTTWGDRWLLGAAYATFDSRSCTLVYTTKVDTHKSQHHIVSDLRHIESYHVRCLEDLRQVSNEGQSHKNHKHTLT